MILKRNMSKRSIQKYYTVVPAKLHHYTGPKNWGNLVTRCNLEYLMQFEGILEIAAHVLDMVHELMFVAQK